MPDAAMTIQDALLCLPYGVHIVTTGGESRPPGAFAACWVMQTSFDPLLVALAVDKTSRSQTLITEAGLFAINFLGKGQTPLAARLGTPSRINPHKFNGVAWHAGLTGVPVLDAALAHLECQVSGHLDPGGDHVIVIGAPVAGALQRREAVLTLEGSGLRYR